MNQGSWAGAGSRGRGARAKCDWMEWLHWMNWVCCWTSGIQAKSSGVFFKFGSLWLMHHLIFFPKILFSRESVELVIVVPLIQRVDLFLNHQHIHSQFGFTLWAEVGFPNAQPMACTRGTSTVASIQSDAKTGWLWGDSRNRCMPSLHPVIWLFAGCVLWTNKRHARWIN